jgi:hypothetical protein
MGRIGRRLGIPIVACCVAAAAALAVLVMNRISGSGPTGVASQPTILSDATREDLSRRALRYAREEYERTPGSARIILVRDLVLEDLLSMGACPTPYEDPSDPRFAIAVVTGDFDMTDVQGMERARPDPEERRFRYILYLFDTAAEGTGVKGMLAARHGGSTFRAILGDPSLPDEVPPGSPPGARESGTIALEPEQCPPVERYEPMDPDEIQPPVSPTAVPGEGSLQQ